MKTIYECYQCLVGMPSSWEMNHGVGVLSCSKYTQSTGDITSWSLLQFLGDLIHHGRLVMSPSIKTLLTFGRIHSN